MINESRGRQRAIRSLPQGEISSAGWVPSRGDAHGTERARVQCGEVVLMQLRVTCNGDRTR